MRGRRIYDFGKINFERIPRRYSAQLLEDQARTWAMICHLSAFVGIIIPFGSIIAPLVIWLIKRAESSFIDDQGKEALNFQISMIIYAVISWILVTIFIGYLLLFAVGIFDIVMVIMAALKANEG
ncbi:MAG TPA: DUF4870 domain-containing protein, partial [candidate division Zixibacteria bacterium]|nr:DUF4870 domain-containing protein [candidate division Zixibacteria bacterium]